MPNRPKTKVRPPERVARQPRRRPGCENNSGARTWLVWAAVGAIVVALSPWARAQATKDTIKETKGQERSISIKIVDPDGQPLAGVLAYNLNRTGTSTTRPADSSELSAVAPPIGKARLVWFSHKPKQLAGLVTISGDSTGPYTVKLRPWAVVTGRVVGPDKKPRPGLVFNVQVSEKPLMFDPSDFAYWRVPVGSDGSFRVEGIVPGFSTKAMIIEPAISFGYSGPPLNPKPGETIDIGTFVTPKIDIPAGAKRHRPPPAPTRQPLPTAKVDESKMRAEYRTDFRKEQYDRRWLRIEGPGGAARLVKPDKSGLRFTVPAGLGNGATVLTKFGVSGDFEITGTFETLSRDRPTTGWGMGPELLVKPPGDWEKFASAGRFVRPNETVYALVHGFKAGEEKKYDAASIPTDFKAGGFRLVRDGSMLHFQVAEGESSVFRELFATDYGTESLEFVRLAAVTGGSQAAVEAMWKDLTIRAEQLPGFTGPMVRPTGPLQNPLLLVVAAVVATVVVASVWLRSTAKKTTSAGLSRSKVSDPARIPARLDQLAAESDAWDEDTLASMEDAAAKFARANPTATNCGHRARFQFLLDRGSLHGTFIAWREVDPEEQERLGASWDEVREKLPPLFEGSYHRGKRQGLFSYYDDRGAVATRRYQDGRVIR
jgi:hypothetical protein